MRWIRGHFSAFREVAELLTIHRDLTLEMAKREISERYSGQMFGTLWAIGHPLFLMAVYVFVFAFVFKTKIGGTYDLPLDYTAYLLSGLIPWLSFQESMNKSCTSISSNGPLVKQVIFPIEVLPAKGVIASLVNQIISLSILVVYVLITHGSLLWTYVLVPYIFILQAMAMLGVAYLLSSVGVFFRDMKDFVQLFGIAGVYVIPVFYLPQWVPHLFKPMLYLNPFSYPMWCYQDALYYGRFEHPWAWVLTTVGSLAVLTLGYRTFRKLRLVFGNVL